MAPKEIMSYYKTGDDELTALFDDGSVEKRKISKAVKQLAKQKLENIDKADDDEFVPHPVAQLEWDLWLIGKFKVEKMLKDKDKPKDKDRQNTGLHGVAFGEMFDDEIIEG